jgi:N-acylneuraminate cytidylyltransferase
MKAVIPVKNSSTRVPGKNFKPFHKDSSLFDLTVEKLLQVLSPSDIYMSCEDQETEHLAEKWGINFILRNPHLADNDTPFFEVFNGVCDHVPGDDDIAWCQVIDPMFDSYEECFDIWNNGHEVLECGAWTKKDIKKHHDSLVVVYPHRDYYLDSSHNPEGFGFGSWHKKSQLLPVKYQLTFTLSILTRESIKRNGYYVGTKPFWYHASNSRVDIDTTQDFEMAQAVYSYFHDGVSTTTG